MAVSSSRQVSIPQAKDIVVDTTGAEIVAEDSPATRDSRGIYLPHYIEPVSHIAIDIGGSLAKVVYFTRSPNPPNGKPRVAGADGLAEQTAPSVPSDAQEGHDGSDAEKGITASSAGHATNPQFTLVSGMEPVAGSWKPVLNGALTPELLANVRHYPSPTAAELERHLSQVNLGEGSSMQREGSSQSNTVEGHAAESASMPASTTLAGADPGHQRNLSGSSPVSSISDKRMSRSNVRRHSKLRRGSLPPNFPGGVLNFARFETEKIEELVVFLKQLISISARTNHVTEAQMKAGVKVLATGGGAHKYYNMLVEELGVPVEKEDEMECLITGLGFITCIPDEVFWYSDELVYSISHPSASQNAKPTADGGVPPDASTTTASLPRPSPSPPTYQVTFDTAGTPQFPCLLVNIGSGVSIIKVDEDGNFERVSGTSLGGGTLWGLLSLMTDARTFDEMLALSEKGDNAACDMLVGDIYGADYSKVGLKSSTIASSFGKVFKKDNGKSAEDRRRNFRQEDISKSLLYAISNNIGQIAHMNAEKYGLDRIYFGGCFIRGHSATISTLSYAIRFWSRGTVRAMFLRHEGFLGSIGAWIKAVDPAVSASSSGAGARTGAEAAAKDSA